VKKIILGSLTMMSTLLAFADNGKTAKDNQDGMNIMGTQGPQLASARPQIDGHGWLVFGDVLFLKMQQVNDQYAYRFVSRGNEEIQTYPSMDFNWSWGFRVGVGCNMKHDEWSTALYYTWYQTDKHTVAGLPSDVMPSFVGGLFTGVGSPLLYDFGTFQSFYVKTDWKFHFNMLDWDLMRSFFVTSRLALQPLIGLKGGWITQHIHQEILVPEGLPVGTFPEQGLQKMHHDQTMWAVGPKAGLNTTWYLGKHVSHFFSLFGDFAASLLWSHTSIDQKINDRGIIFTKTKDLAFNYTITCLQLALGFGWDTNFNKDRCHFGMKLGYELQQWANFSGINFNLPGDLGLQGGFLRGKFDF